MTDKKVCGGCESFCELMGARLTGMCRLHQSKFIDDINVVMVDDKPEDHDCKCWQPRREDETT